MKKIYIVTSGTYSDYTICSVFSTRQKADMFVEKKGSEYRVEEYNLDSCTNYPDMLFWSIRITYNDMQVVSCDPIPDNELKNIHENEFYCNNPFGTLYINLVIKAEVMSKAVKIAEERMMQIKALESIKYPFLRQECVLIPYSYYTQKVYPRYDFYTGEIVLREKQNIDVLNVKIRRE